MEIEKDRAVLITMTCTLLHNFLRNSRSSRNIYTPPGTFDTIVNDVITHEGSWRDNQSMDSAIRPLQTVGRRGPRTAEDIRIEFATFFQNNML